MPYYQIIGIVVCIIMLVTKPSTIGKAIWYILIGVNSIVILLWCLGSTPLHDRFNYIESKHFEAMNQKK